MRFDFNKLIVITLFILGCQKNDPVFMNMLNEMEHSVAKPSLEKFRSMSEDRSISYYHFIGGLFFFDSILRRNDGEIIKFFAKKSGILSQKDIALISFRSLHRKINDRPINLDTQVKDIINKRNEISECEKNEMNKYKKIRTIYKNGDTISFGVYVEIISKTRNGIYFCCPFNYWEFDKNKDLLIKGIIIIPKGIPYYSDLKIKICSMNRYDTELLSKKISVGDTIYVPLDKTILFR